MSHGFPCPSTVNFFDKANPSDAQVVGAPVLDGHLDLFVFLELAVHRSFDQIRKFLVRREAERDDLSGGERRGLFRERRREDLPLA